METLLVTLVLVDVAVTAGVGVSLWRRTTPTPPTVVTSTEAEAPEWGTPERVEWHRELRNYHRKKLSEAQQAIRADAAVED